MEDKWSKLEEIVRRVVREEIAGIGNKKPKIECINGRWVGVTEEQIAAWKDAYPAVEVDTELKKMAAWIVSNPMMAPKSQLGRFVNSWLTKEQNRASIRSIPMQKNPAPPNLCEWCLKPSTGAVNGRRACDAHFSDAMNGPPPKFMPGQVAKPVAGS